jgi:hypothetical protein
MALGPGRRKFDNSSISLDKGQFRLPGAGSFKSEADTDTYPGFS